MKTQLLLLANAAGLLLTASLHGATNTWTISNFQFSPQTLKINAGDSVLFKNTSGFHSATCEEPDSVCGGHGLASSPWSSTSQFNTPGTYHYRCVEHSADFTSGMIGTLIVLPQITPAVLSGVRLATNGAITFSVTGTASVPQVVEGSVDFKTWTALSTNNPPDGKFTYSETPAQPWRFYRVRE